MSSEELHPDLQQLDADIEATRHAEAEMAWDFTPSKPYEPLPGRTSELSRDPATGEIQLPADHAYIKKIVGEAATDAATRINQRPNPGA